jgi:hypothetical protein
VEQSITILLPPLQQVAERRLSNALALCDTALRDTALGDTSDRTSPDGR